ncbi:hypothetical protein T4D_1631, partial [Trichinella pseudospiralis]
LTFVASGSVVTCDVKYKEWSNEKVKTRTTRSRTIEEKESLSSPREGSNALKTGF